MQVDVREPSPVVWISAQIWNVEVKCLYKPGTQGLSESSFSSWWKCSNNPSAVYNLVARSHVDPVQFCAYAVTECQAANGMVLNATPQKKCAVKWVKWNDGHQQLVVMRCKVSSCGSYAEWHCGMNLSISRCSCWMCVKCCSAVGWKWPWECRSSKLQVASQQSVLMYHCWPSNCRKDDIGSHILLPSHTCLFLPKSTSRASSSVNLLSKRDDVIHQPVSCDVSSDVESVQL